MEEYLIKKETLNAIGDSMRSHLDSKSLFTPEDMATGFDSHIDWQADLLAQLQELIDNLPEAGSGGSSEDLEALGVLCDWMIMTDSESIPTVKIINYHPSYYLHCTIIELAMRENESQSFDITIAPDDSVSQTFTKLTSERKISVEGVWWSANEKV